MGVAFLGVPLASLKQMATIFPSMGESFVNSYLLYLAKFLAYALMGESQIR
jgi:hypothetical protein